MKQIEIINLNFSYEEKIETLSDISFSVDEGEYVSVLGHNGSGKSTLAKLLVGLLDRGSGEIILFDKPLNKENLYSIRNKMALVFQNPDNQFIGATVEDDIAFGLENRCIESNKMQEIIEHYAREVGMIEYLDREPTMLSGGQKQRVAIAGALALKPDILILDEATSMLDPKGKREIKELIVRIRKENPKLTILSITHDIEEAFSSDRVIVLNKGRLVADGKPEIVLKDANEMKRLHLDIPFVLDLENKLESRGISIKTCKKIDELVEEIWALK